MDGHEAADRKNLYFRLEMVFLGFLVLASFVFSIVLVRRGDAPGWFNSKEAFQTSLQFFTVAVLGGAVALWYRHLESRRAQERERAEKARERRDAERSALEEFYQSLIEVHNDCKKVRRSLRAISYDKGNERACERRDFERLMDQLEDIQLRAETKKEEINVREQLFRPKQEELGKKLGQIEEYLADLLDQYEDSGTPHQQQVDQEIVLSEELRDFIRPRKVSEKINKEYFLPAKDIRDALFYLIASTFSTPAEPRAAV